MMLWGYGDAGWVMAVAMIMAVLLIALTVAFDAAAAILIDHGFPPALARAATLATSLADISVGILVAWRATCRTGLLAGIALSLAYMAGAAILTPEMWLDPLGALVKTGPAVVLMMVALAILDDHMRDAIERLTG